MKIIEKIIEKAKDKNKIIVLPESMDERVLKAASIVREKDICKIILIGNENDIKEKYHDINFYDIKFIDPESSELTDKFINDLYLLRKEKGLSLEDAKNFILNDYMYYACMLVYEGYADGAVSGACHSTANTLRPALQIIRTKPDTKLVSAFFLEEVPNCDFGDQGTFIFADSGLNQNPTSEELASIAIDSAKSFERLTGDAPYVAFLSHSTKGSAKHDDVTKVVDAVNIAKKETQEFAMDGELQLDAAIVPEIAKIKAPDSNVAGKANVLVFPDLDAGNIGYKLVQRLAKADAYGPITQGINKPVNDLSRGCSVEDIVGTIAITVIQCD